MKDMSASSNDNYKYIIFWFLEAVLLRGYSQGATVNVSPGDVLQAAVDEAMDGDVIEVESG